MRQYLNLPLFCLPNVDYVFFFLPATVFHPYDFIFLLKVHKYFTFLFCGGKTKGRANKELTWEVQEVVNQPQQTLTKHIHKIYLIPLQSNLQCVCCCYCRCCCCFYFASVVRLMCSYSSFSYFLLLLLPNIYYLHMYIPFKWLFFPCCCCFLHYIIFSFTFWKCAFYCFAWYTVFVHLLSFSVVRLRRQLLLLLLLPHFELLHSFHFKFMKSGCILFTLFFFLHLMNECCYLNLVFFLSLFFQLHSITHCFKKITHSIKLS